MDHMREELLGLKPHPFGDVSGLQGRTTQRNKKPVADTTSPMVHVGLQQTVQRQTHVDVPIEWPRHLLELL